MNTIVKIVGIKIAVAIATVVVMDKIETVAFKKFIK